MGCPGDYTVRNFLKIWIYCPISKNLTREGFISAIEKIKDLDIGVGDKISYGKFDHQGLDKVYYSIVINGKEVALTNWVEQATK